MAGANKPDGKSNTQRVPFTRRDADRIGRVVRTVEAGDKKGQPLTFGSRQQGTGGGGSTIRVAKFTGNWAYSTFKTCEFLYVTTTPNTVSVVNDMFSSLVGSGTTDINCVVLKEGTAWSLVNVEHYISGFMLQDFNLSTSELRITRSVVNFVGGSTTAQVISVANCATQVASVTSQSLFFG
jgi:hypothetical protein